MRIVIVGSSSCGKSTFARRLSSLLEIPHIELDRLYWGPNWTPVSAAVFQGKVSDATAAPAWVCDGNYRVVRNMIWCRAEMLIWLDYPFRIVLYRAFTRTLRRLVTREELFGGNRESIAQVFHSDWIPWWVIRTFHRRRRELTGLIRDPSFAHLRILRFQGPKEAELYLRDPCWLEPL